MKLGIEWGKIKLEGVGEINEEGTYEMKISYRINWGMEWEGTNIIRYWN